MPPPRRALGRELSIKVLYQAFGSTPVNVGMFALARRLLGRYAPGIVTDNKKDRIDHRKKHQDLESLFNPTVVSAEIGFNKASTEIFLHAVNCDMPHAPALVEGHVTIRGREKSLRPSGACNRLPGESSPVARSARSNRDLFVYAPGTCSRPAT